jgi:CelD/BcsL family acetyltransferase involved in cellulose biosynthesis
MIADAAVGAGLHRVEVLRADARLAEIAAAWNALWRRADGLVFQDWGWIDAWRRTDPARARRSLLVGLLWSGDRLDAVLPFAVTRRSSVRVLEWAAKEHSDFCDVLAAPDCEPQALRRLWRETLGAGGYDLAYINRLLPEAAAWPLIRDPQGPVTLQPNPRFEDNFRVVGDWADGDAWFESQPKKTRQNYRRGRRLIEDEGKALTLRLIGPDEPLGPLIDRVGALKRDWLARSGQVSDLFDEGSPALAALVEAMRQRQVLRVFVEECDGEAIAISINFVQRGRMMVFVNAYDPAYERGSPGILLMVDYIKWSLDQGIREIDFLCGGEEYKRRFATRELVLRSVAGARTPVGRLALIGEAAQRRVKAWREARAKG